MDIVFQLLGGIAGIGSLVCLVMVLIQMFQHEESKTVAIVSLVLICCGGGLIVFVYGWIKSREWGITNIMLAWSACMVFGLLFNVASLLTNPQFMQQMQQIR